MAAYSGKQTGEHALLRQIMDTFNAGDIVIGDAYYGSFFLIATLLHRKVDVVFPQHGGRHTDFRSGSRLGKRDHLTDWEKPAKPDWMDAQTYAAFPQRIRVRETTVSTQQRGYRTVSHIIVSTFTDPALVSATDLSELYGYRWFVELDFRSVKTVMRMDILRGKTPDMVRKEVWAHLLAYNLIRKIMAQAAVHHHTKPREMSFKLALQMIGAFRQAGLLQENDLSLLQALFTAIVTKKTRQQLGRHEVRMVKRRPKPFPRLQKPRAFYKKAGI